MSYTIILSAYATHTNFLYDSMAKLFNTQNIHVWSLFLIYGYIIYPLGPIALCNVEIYIKPYKLRRNTGIRDH